jgi:feruloyl-CoA synthase
MASEVGSLFASPRIVAGRAGEPRSDGSLLLRSADPLGDYPVTVVHSFRRWASADPGHPLAAERGPDGGWRTRTYGEAAAAADAIGQALLDRELGPDRPLLVLSGNSVDHMLLTLGAMTAGVPIAPVSVAYSLQSHDHARIRAIAELIKPGAVFAEDAGRFGPALDALPAIPAIVSEGSRPGADRLGDLLVTTPGRAVTAAFGALDPEAVAKILFTSGSTGTPKGVLNTHRMLSANQRMISQAWPFLAAERPVIVDWLPWSHTFGGNHNLNMMFTSGGTLYVDGGRPAPGMFAQTVRNLTDVPPTVYFNVPAGYAQLIPALEADPQFAERFFSRLRLMFNAAAALPAALRERLGELAARSAGRSIPVTGSWGATETAPAVTSAHYDYADARCIGVPLPGAEVKLVPVEDAYEIRAKGPNVTPGYFARPDLTAEAFDADGFYRTGDAVVLADPGDPSAGLLFRGRIAEDFKLETGTFVRVGALRTALLSTAPILSDAVIAGEDRDCACALVWLNAAETRKLIGEEPRPGGELISHEAVHKVLAQALADLNATAGSAARVERLVVLASPADLDAGEITDKGYINQRKVLARRAALVEMLYAEPVPPGVVVSGRTGRTALCATAMSRSRRAWRGVHRSSSGRARWRRYPALTSPRT